MSTVTDVTKQILNRQNWWLRLQWCVSSNLKSGCFQVKKCASYYIEGGKNHMEIFSCTWKCLTWRLWCIYSQLSHAKNIFTAWELRVKTAIFVNKSLLLELGNKLISPIELSLLHFFKCLFIFERETEKERERGRGRERGRYRIWTRLQALSYQHRAQRRAWTYKLWDHNLSWSSEGA